MEEKQEIEEQEPIPTGQKRFDNFWIWLILSFVICLVLYNIWGIVELINLPVLVP